MFNQKNCEIEVIKGKVHMITIEKLEGIKNIIVVHNIKLIASKTEYTMIVQHWTLFFFEGVSSLHL